MNNIIEFLHQHRAEGFYPQYGFAGVNKTARLWVPGNKPLGSPEHTARIASECALVGTSQLCFRSLAQPQHSQNALVTWLGIDIDDDPQIGPIKLALAGVIPFSLRTSNSGRGIHVFVRLTTPIEAPYLQARAICKALTKQVTDILDAHNIVWCSGSPRLFWVLGGKQEWIERTEETWDAPTPNTTPVPAVPQNQPENRVETGTGIAGLGFGEIRGRHQCHVGTVVRQLRARGETIHTKSRMSGTNTDVNGFIEVGPGFISLFSNPDGKIIWRWAE